ncbi:MAG TPA: hypothetical protein PLF42_17875, partial [Anaerolineales bacterium]|nr:hypothetical protein [Anaerolineales bacterium]
LFSEDLAASEEEAGEAVPVLHEKRRGGRNGFGGCLLKIIRDFEGASRWRRQGHTDIISTESPPRSECCGYT